MTPGRQRCMRRRAQPAGSEPGKGYTNSATSGSTLGATRRAVRSPVLAHVDLCNQRFGCLAVPWVQRVGHAQPTGGPTAMDGGLLKRLALRTSQRLTPPRCQLYGRRPVAFDAFAGLALFRDVSSASRLNAVNAPQRPPGLTVGCQYGQRSRQYPSTPTSRMRS